MDTSMYDLEPNIRKARFIVSNTKVYTLEFDYNIQMKEIKFMIGTAAHLRKNSFRLFSEGQEYTQCNEESFHEVFPEQKLVVFTLEKGEGEAFDDTDLVLQINNPCPDHKEKFMLYYCFNCGCSCCCECFLSGKHKGHNAQDKCYYLLSSRFLSEKMFEGWSSRPYEDYQISADLTELKTRLDKVFFSQLHQMLKEIQGKCNDLIDCFNGINNESLGNFRDSIRDEKVSCTKVLDFLKDKCNIKEIVSNPEIFVKFHQAFVTIGKQENEKLRQNLKKFQDLNQDVPDQITKFVSSVYNDILGFLKIQLVNEQYGKLKNLIYLKQILPVNQKMIIQQYCGKNDMNSVLRNSN